MSEETTSEQQQHQRPSAVLPDIRRLLEDDELSEDGREELRALLLNSSRTRALMEDMHTKMCACRTQLSVRDIRDPGAQDLIIVAGMQYHNKLVKQQTRSHHFLEMELEDRADRRELEEDAKRQEQERQEKRKRELEARKAKAALAKATDEQAAEVVVEKRKQPDAPEKPSSRSKRTRRLDVAPVALSPAPMET